MKMIYAGLDRVDDSTTGTGLFLYIRPEGQVRGGPFDHARWLAKIHEEAVYEQITAGNRSRASYPHSNEQKPIIRVSMECPAMTGILT
jgi:hypothetical protein